MKATLSTDHQNDLIDRFITMIEDTGLQFGGGGSSEWEGVVETFEGGSTTDDQRAVVLAWLERQDDVIDCAVRENFDGWYGVPWEDKWQISTRIGCPKPVESLLRNDHGFRSC